MKKNSFGVIIVDIDDFKKVNDMYGHQVGDKVLIIVADTLSQTIRTGDVLARWGGEEFVVLVPDVDKEKISFVAEKLRSAVENMNISEVGTITVSLGVSLFVGNDTEETMMYRSDLALYKSKNNGRNRVEFL
jgi:diguanylate cyclase (GGDEF)-like protein